MLRMGAKKGDVLGMVVPNIPEFPIAFLGAVGVGITITTMNPTYRPGQSNKAFARLISVADVEIEFVIAVNSSYCYYYKVLTRFNLQFYDSKLIKRHCFSVTFHDQSVPHRSNSKVGMRENCNRNFESAVRTLPHQNLDGVL